MSVRSLALKTKQYVEELNSQLKTLGVITTVGGITYNEEKSDPVRNNMTDKKIIERCCDVEKYFIKAYHNSLNEHLPYTGLRDILRYQLNGIKDAFTQLKLLNSVMINEPALAEAF